MHSLMAKRNNFAMFGLGTAAFLTFMLGKEEYGVEMLKVTAIRDYDGIISVARIPDEIKGAISLHGTLVPVTDLRLMFDTEPAKVELYTPVIVLSSKNQTLGIVVDWISDVRRISAAEVEPVQSAGPLVQAGCIAGIVPVRDGALHLIDVEKLISGFDRNPVCLVR